MRYVSLDPGGTTGVVIASLEGDKYRLEAQQIGPGPHHEALWDLLYTRSPDLIICESFEYRPPKKDDPAYKHVNIKLDSVEYIGLVKLWSKLVKTPVVFQSAATGKGFWWDQKSCKKTPKYDRLKDVGLYLPGKQHARDAMRHWLHYCTFTLMDDRYTRRLLRPTP